MAWLLAYHDRTTTKHKMKNTFNFTTLAIGILISILALTNTSAVADNKERDDFKSLFTVNSELLKGIEVEILAEEIEVSSDKRIIILNSDKQVVYECRDKADEKLCIMLRRSDLIMQTETSSYYLLGD
jgi:hypothetical protein